MLSPEITKESGAAQLLACPVKHLALWNVCLYFGSVYLIFLCLHGDGEFSQDPNLYYVIKARSCKSCEFFVIDFESYIDILTLTCFADDVLPK